MVKAGFRNYIINLPRTSGHDYPRDVKWVVDGLAAIRSIPPSATSEEYLKTLVTFITPSAEVRAKSLELLWRHI